MSTIDKWTHTEPTFTANASESSAACHSGPVSDTARELADANKRYTYRTALGMVGIEDGGEPLLTHNLTAVDALRVSLLLLQATCEIKTGGKR